jgi:TRAP-type C4-dicarboxylate transport system permease small subunit
MNLLGRGLRLSTTCLYSALMLATVAAVFFRYVLNNSLVWAEELSRYLFVWTVCLGAAMGVERGSHVSVDSLLASLPRRAQAVVALGIECGVLAFLLVVLVQGAKLTLFGLQSFSLAMQIPMAWVYAALPVGAVLMGLYTLRRMGRCWRAVRSPERATPDAA